MILTVFAVRDILTESFHPPFFERHAGLATRAFADAINNPQQPTDLNRHPQHFELWRLSTFDDQTGEFNHADLNAMPVRIVRGEEVRETKQ